jgi:hypothetical protein
MVLGNISITTSSSRQPQPRPAWWLATLFGWPRYLAGGYSSVSDPESDLLEKSREKYAFKFLQKIRIAKAAPNAAASNHCRK